MERKRQILNFAKNNRTTIISVVLIVTSLIILTPILGSIIQPPPAPMNGVGYARILLYDPFHNTYVNGKVDLIKVNNTNEYFSRGVSTNTTIHLTEPCYVIFNGTTLGTTRIYHYMSGSVEANENQNEPYMNIFNIYEIANSTNVEMLLYRLNSSIFGNFGGVDISNKINTTLAFRIYNNDVYKYVGRNAWLPDIYSNSTAVSMNATGYSLFLYFNGEIESEWCLSSGMNNTIYKINDRSIVQIIPGNGQEFDNDKKMYYYDVEVFLPKTLNIDEIGLFYGEITDWYKITNVLEII